MNFKMFTVDRYTHCTVYSDDHLFQNVFSMIIKLTEARCWEGGQGEKCLLCVI